MGDIKNDVLVKLNTSTTVAFYTDTILNTWFNEAYMWAASYKKWPFTEAKDTSLTFSTGTEIYALPSQFKSNSVRHLTVGTNPAYNIGKTEFGDYLYFREWMTSASDRLFAEFTRNLYINPNLDVNGTITLYGQKNITSLDGTNADSGNTTVFSGGEEEGNEAIVYKIMSFAMMRERNMAVAAKGKPSGEFALYDQKASAILEAIWKRITDEKFAAQQRNQGMFHRIDVLRGGFEEEVFKRDQFF